MLVSYIKTNGETAQFHLSDWLARQLTQIKEKINKKDSDYVMVIDGQEGSGKSTLATQVCHFIDPTFKEERMCLTPEELISKINSCEKGQAVVFDEAFTGLSSRRAMTQINNVLVEMMMEMRKKNLFVVMCIPSVFYLEKYVALHRARSLLHTYQSKGRRGQYMAYNQNKLKLLYLVGKQKMSYAFPRVAIKERFPSIAPINWEHYEERKILALKKKEKGTLAQKQSFQRDLCLLWLKKHGYSPSKMATVLNHNGATLNERSIRDIFIKLKEKKGISTIKVPKGVVKTSGTGGKILP